MDLFHLLLVSAFALFLTLLLTPLVRDAFLRMSILDRPDGRRKFHNQPVPRVGGIPITFSYIAAFGLWLALGAGTNPHELAFIGRMLPAAAIVFATGLVDDVFGLRPWQKLAGQGFASTVAMWAGVRIHGISGFELSTPLSLLLTMAWLIGCTNAFNLIDGLDGLASGMGLFATLTTFVAALLHGNQMLAVITLPLAGCLLGFLRYNFNPASVFLGDSGSLLIGFLLGSYAVVWSQKSATLLAMTAPLMALAVPLLDTGLAITRRWLRGQPIFSGDRGHIHHKLLERGLTHRRVVLMLYLAGGGFAVLSLLQSVAANRYGGLVVILFALVTWFGIQYLGYFEFRTAGRTLLGGAIQRNLRGQIHLHMIEAEIRECLSANQCWEVVSQASQRCGFNHVRACFHGRLLQTWPSPARPTWELRVGLPNGDFVHLFRESGEPDPPPMLAGLAELLARELGSKLQQLRVPIDTDIPSILKLASGIAAAGAGIKPALPEPPREVRSHAGD
jgi:UDP-GlcNAc:undecaprenyl-phosphate GlcNAc-1-phosphate transferase